MRNEDQGVRLVHAAIRRTVRLGRQGWLLAQQGWLLARRAARVTRRLAGAPAARRAGTAAAILTVTLVSVVIGVLLGAHTDAEVGPFHARLSLHPSLVGDTEVDLPPLGALHLDSHDGPAHLSIQFQALDQRRTEALINEPAALTQASETAVEDIIRATIQLSVRTLGAVVLSALLLSALAFRDVRRVAWSGGLALAVTATGLAASIGTFRADAIEEPRYEGLLVNAPAVVGDARRLANRYDQYAAQLQGLVNNVSQLYTRISTLPVYQGDPNTIRVLHVSDLHLNPTAWSVIRTVVDQFDIGVVVDTGDINDWGSEPEASFVSSIGLLGVPYVFVRGNHDSTRTTAAVAGEPNAIVLDNATVSVAGLTIAGIGDPLFTPDKPDGSDNTPESEAALFAAGEQLAEKIRESTRPVHIAAVHDPKMAPPLAGVAPVVLAGHTHKRDVRVLPPPTAEQTATRLLVEGSTGGAGLRGIRREEPLPLSLSVLYFDTAGALQAHDDIQVGGTGQAQVRLERHVVDPEELAGVKPSPTAQPSATPQPTATARPSPTPDATPSR